MDEQHVRRLIARASRLALVSTAALLVGCYDQLPPQAPPPAEMPAVTLPSGQLPANRVWVVFDVPGDHANVLTTVGTTSSTDADGNTTTSNVQKKLCTTPCVSDLRPGKHQIEFDPAARGQPSSIIDLDLKDSMVVRQTMPVETSPARDGRGYVALASALLAANSFAFFIVAVSGARRTIPAACLRRTPRPTITSRWSARSRARRARSGGSPSS
jgi:hypothetical protein